MVKSGATCERECRKWPILLKIREQKENLGKIVTGTIFAHKVSKEVKVSMTVSQEWFAL